MPAKTPPAARPYIPAPGFIRTISKLILFTIHPRMPSPSDSPLDTPTDPFVIEPSSQLSYPPGFIEPAVPSSLKPFLIVFRANPFTTHDGLRGRPVAAPTYNYTYPGDTQPIMLEFQLSLGSSGFEPNSDAASGSPSPVPDVTSKPGLLRYLDGDAALSTTFPESPRAEFEATTWSTTPLYHPHPSRQSFPQLGSTHRSPPTFDTHSRINDQDHPFTRVDRTPELEAAPFRPTTLIYPPSLAYHVHQTGSESESMYAPEPTLQVGQDPSNGYQYGYNSSNTSGSDGYSTAHASSTAPHFHSQDDSYDRGYSQSQQSFPVPYARSNEVSSQHTLFATPAQMAIPSQQEGIYPSSNSDPSPSPYPTGDLDSNNDQSPGHTASLSLDPHHPTDYHYVHDGTQLRNGHDFPIAQSDVGARDIRFSSSPHQAHPGLARRLSLPVYHLHSHESHFRVTPRGSDQIASRGFEQGPSALEQPTGGLQHSSRSSSMSVFDRRGSFAPDRPVSRTSSSAFNRLPHEAFSHSGGSVSLADPTSSSPPILRALDHPNLASFDRPASSTFSPFTRRPSLDPDHMPGTITPMRIFDSPAPTMSPTRSLSPSMSSLPVDQPSTSRSARQFAPFPPGGMNRATSGGKDHLCTVCNKKCKRPSTLKTHMHTHTGERPHLCPVKSCGSRFSVQSNLRRHVKRHNLKLGKTTSQTPRSKRTAARKEESRESASRVLQERKNVQPWCPESLRGMRNAKSLSSRPPFGLPEGAAPLSAPLPAVRPHGHPGDENYEDRDSFFYAHETDQPTPYHPFVWGLRPTLPGPMPSQADREARARGAYSFGGTLTGSGSSSG